MLTDFRQRSGGVIYWPIKRPFSFLEMVSQMIMPSILFFLAVRREYRNYDGP